MGVTLFYVFLFTSHLLHFVYGGVNSYVITSVADPIDHGEGPHWDWKRQVLYYVDTFNPKIIRLKDGKVTEQTIGKSISIGTITPVANTENKFLLTCDTTVRILEWDGLTNNSGDNYYKPVIGNLEPTKPNNQANDGKADVSGQFWIGTLTRNDDGSVADNGGTLYLIRSNGTAEAKLQNVSISNGLAWNKNNTKFFYIDSSLRSIDVFHYNLEEETISNRSQLFSLNEMLDIPLNAITDGMTIDSNDNLWVAVYGGSAVLHVDSESGKLIRKIEMPVSQVTSVAFGGKNLDILYATTSRHVLNETMLKEEPQAGSTFAITGLGVTGVPMNEFIYEKES